MERKGQKMLRELPLKPLGGVPAGRFAGTAFDVEPAGWPTRCGGATRGGRKPAGAVADDATGSGPEHAPLALCADHRRREPVSTRQAGGELSGIDSIASTLPAGVRSWESLPSKAIACCARQLVEAAQIAVRFDPGMKKQYLHRCHQKPKGVAKDTAARKISRTTLLDATHQLGVSGDRAYREQPAGAPGRRKLDRRTDWAALASCTEARDVRLEESWSMCLGRIDVVGGTIFGKKITTAGD